MFLSNKVALWNTYEYYNLTKFDQYPKFWQGPFLNFNDSTKEWKIPFHV